MTRPVQARGHDWEGEGGYDVDYSSKDYKGGHEGYGPGYWYPPHHRRHPYPRPHDYPYGPDYPHEHGYRDWYEYGYYDEASCRSLTPQPSRHPDCPR